MTDLDKDVREKFLKNLVLVITSVKKSYKEKCIGKIRADFQNLMIHYDIIIKRVSHGHSRTAKQRIKKSLARPVYRLDNN